jgi:hypothetical protein
MWVRYCLTFLTVKIRIRIGVPGEKEATPVPQSVQGLPTRLAEEDRLGGHQRLQVHLVVTHLVQNGQGCCSNLPVQHFKYLVSFNGLTNVAAPEPHHCGTYCRNHITLQLRLLYSNLLNF